MCLAADCDILAREMSPTVIRCPGCGAADTSPEGPGGLHTCVYCGVRYRFSGGTPTLTESAATRGPQMVLVAAGLFIVLGLVAAFIVFAGDSDESPPPSRDRGRSVERPAPPAPPRQPDPPAVNNPSVSVEAPAEELAPATAEFALETVQRSSTKALWIYGYLHNTSPFALGRTKVVAVFYDKDGAELGNESGFTEDDVIPSGARTATVLLVSNPPAAYDRLEFEVQAQRPTYLPAQVGGLEVETDAPRRDSLLGWKYSGKVHNKSGQAAKFVKVRVLAFDPDDKLAGHAVTYASTDALPDGATARFDGTMLGNTKDFKRFEFLVSGRPAD